MLLRCSAKASGWQGWVDGGCCRCWGHLGQHVQCLHCYHHHRGCLLLWYCCCGAMSWLHQHWQLCQIHHGWINSDWICLCDSWLCQGRLLMGWVWLRIACQWLWQQSKVASEWQECFCVAVYLSSELQGQILVNQIQEVRRACCAQVCCMHAS